MSNTVTARSSSVHANRTRVAFDSRRPIRSAAFGIGVVEPVAPVAPAPTVRLTGCPIKNGELNRRIFEWSQANMPFDGDDAAWEAFRLARSVEHSRIQDEVFRVAPAAPAQDDDYLPTDADRRWNAEHPSNQHSYFCPGERRPSVSARRSSRPLPHRPTPARPAQYQPIRATTPQRGIEVPARHPVAPRPSPTPKPTPTKPVKSFTVAEPAGVDFQDDWAYSRAARRQSSPPRMTHAESLERRAADLRPSGEPFDGPYWDQYLATVDRMDAAGVTW